MDVPPCYRCITSCQDEKSLLHRLLAISPMCLDHGKTTYDTNPPGKIFKSPILFRCCRSSDSWVGNCELPAKRIAKAADSKAGYVRGRCIAAHLMCYINFERIAGWNG